MSEMTHKERILAAMMKKEVDYVPFVGTFNPLSEAQRRGHTYNFPWKLDDPEEVRVRHCVEELGIADVIDISFPFTDPEVPQKVLRNGDMLRKEIETPAGVLSAEVRTDERWPHGEDIVFASDFTAHYTKPWISTMEDIEKLRYIFKPLSKMKQSIQDACLQRLRNKRALADRYQLPLTGIAGMGLTLGLQMFLPEPLMIMTMEEPEIIEAFIALEHEVVLDNMRYLLENGVDIISRNGFYETSDFYSPASLREFLFKPLNEEFDLIRQAGALSSYTINTGIMPMLDYLAELRYDSSFGIDISFPNMDLDKLVAALGANKAFELGPCSHNHYFVNDEAITRGAIQTVFEHFPKRGLVIRPSVSLHSIMPWKSFLVSIDEWKKFR